MPPSPTFGTKVGLGEPRSFGAGDLRFQMEIWKYGSLNKEIWKLIWKRIWKCRNECGNECGSKCGNMEMNMEVKCGNMEVKYGKNKEK